MKKRLCITPCGKKKIWDKHPEAGPSVARDVYCGAFANTCQAYADSFFDAWVVLSAKHGFLWPDDVVGENYDLAFDSKSEQVITPAQLRQQIIEKQLDQYAEIVVLGGKKYERVVRAIFDEPANSLQFPLRQFKGIGYMLQALNEAVRDGKEVER